jgi:TctA family transporter
MKDYLKELLKDKTDCYSLREAVIAVCMLLVVASWIAQLAFDVSTPEYMFYSIVSLIATGCFGYSIEKKPNNQPLK